MAIMLGGAAFHAAHKLKAKLTTIGAHDLGIPLERAVYKDGIVSDREAPQNKRSWGDLVQIAFRNYHRMPAGLEPGLAVSHVMQVPSGGTLPKPDGRLQMHPLFSFELHLTMLA